MDTTTIWRVEDPNGNGLYTSPLSAGVPQDLFGQLYGPDHPGPFSDDRLRSYVESTGRLTSDYRFGFACFMHYRAWCFAPELRSELARVGLLLRTYEVPTEDVVFGTHQVMFLPRAARLVDTYAPNID